MGWMVAAILGVVGLIAAILAYFLWAGPTVDIQFSIPGWIIVAIIFSVAAGFALKFAP